MRKLRYLVLGVVMAIAACATGSIDGRGTQALQSVNATLAVANTQMAAGKMSKETHANILKWAEGAKAAIVAAVKAGDAAELTAIKADADIGTIKISDGVVK